MYVINEGYFNELTKISHKLTYCHILTKKKESFLGASMLVPNSEYWQQKLVAGNFSGDRISEARAALPKCFFFFH